MSPLTTGETSRKEVGGGLSLPSRLGVSPPGRRPVRTGTMTMAPPTGPEKEPAKGVAQPRDARLTPGSYAAVYGPHSNWKPMTKAKLSQHVNTALVKALQAGVGEEGRRVARRRS